MYTLKAIAYSEITGDVWECDGDMQGVYYTLSSIISKGKAGCLCIF